MMFCASFGLIGVVAFIVLVQGYTVGRKAITGYGPYEGPPDKHGGSNGPSHRPVGGDPLAPNYEAAKSTPPRNTRMACDDVLNWGSVAAVRESEDARLRGRASSTGRESSDDASSAVPSFIGDRQGLPLKEQPLSRHRELRESFLDEPLGESRVQRAAREIDEAMIGAGEYELEHGSKDYRDLANDQTPDIVEAWDYYHNDDYDL